MRIGLISDTHNRVPARIFDDFAGVDLIIHAGDIGSQKVLDELKIIAPVKAVYGNMDGFPLTGNLSRIDCMKLDGLNLCLTHIVNSPKSFAFELFKMGKQADIIVFGHTHRAEQVWFNDILFINPGSAVQARDDRGPSVAILTIEENKPQVEFIFFNSQKPRI